MHIDYEAAELAQKLAPNKAEVVRPLLEIGIEQHHLGEAHGQVMQGEQARHPARHATSESRLAHERNVLRSVAQVEPAEEILIVHGSRNSSAVVFEILEVGFDHGMHMTHLGHEHVLALHYAVKHVIEGYSGRRRLGFRAWRRRNRRSLGHTRGWLGWSGGRILSAGRECAG